MAVDLYFRTTSLEAFEDLMEQLGHGRRLEVLEGEGEEARLVTVFLYDHGVDVAVIPPGEFEVQKAVIDLVMGKDGEEFVVVDPGIADDVNWYFNVRLSGAKEQEDKEAAAALVAKVMASPEEPENKVMALDVVTAKLEDLEDSKTGREFLEVAIEEAKVSLWPGGQTRQGKVVEVVGKGEVELIHPEPQFPRRVWF